MRTIKTLIAAAMLTIGLAAMAAQPVIYTLNLASVNLNPGTTYITNPVWTTSSGAPLTNLDVVFESQFTLYCVAQAAATNGITTAGTNGAVTISGLVSPDNVTWTSSNAPAAFTIGQNSSNSVVSMPYSNCAATSWRYWGGVLTVTVASTNLAYGPTYTNLGGPSVLQLKSFWKLP